MPPFLRIAHRGAPFRALENTLESFQLARSAGASAFELDVWLSRDGVPMVFHDPTLKRLAGNRCRLSSLSLFELGKIQLRDGHVIPTLEATMGLLSGQEVRVYVELKDPSPAVVSAVMGVCSGFEGQCVLSSFHHRHLEVAGDAFATQALVGRSFRGSLEMLPGTEVGIPDALATPRFFNRWAALNKPVMVYTVNDLERERTLQQLGASGVYVDTW